MELEFEMNQGIVESRHCPDDGLVYTPANLGPAIGMSDLTLFRLMSQEPDRLPPPIYLSKLGAKKQKRVWLKTTVAQWLQERQEHGVKQPGAALPVQPLKAAAPAATRRGRGRPRKLEASRLQGGAAA